ncbi:MAG: LytTR family DNA-binding domain-containing protein [Emticicia sp.]|nr:LytTR family DNA-binding domain-containing protein [Emticicia sp.]
MKTQQLLQSEIHIGGHQTINPEEVVRLQADVNYTTVYFANGKKTLVATTLKSMESRFGSFPKFVRINKSVIINIDCIRKKDEEKITLQNGETFIASRRRKKAVFELMKF